MPDEEIPDFQSLGRDHAGRAEHEQAVTAFREALRRNAGGRSTYRDLGLSLSALGRLADAADAFARAVEESPADVSALHRLGRTLMRQHLAEKALPFLRRAAQIAPHKGAIHCDLARTLRSLDRFGEAEDVLGQALAVTPADAGLLMENARLLASRGRHKEAVPLLRSLVAIDPDASRAHRDLIKALSLAGDFQGALTAAAAAVGHLPAEPAHHHGHGRLLARAGRHGEAAAALRRAVELDPKHPGALRDLGSASRILGRHGEAAKALSEAAALAPDDAVSRHELGRALASMGRYLEAADAFRQALELDPGRHKARRELKEALSALRRAGSFSQFCPPEWQENVDCSVALCFLRDVTEADRLWLRALDGLFAECIAPAGMREAAAAPEAPTLRWIEGDWRACITASEADWILPVTAGLPDRGLVEALRRRAGAGIGVVCARSDGVDDMFRLFLAAPLKVCAELAGASTPWDDCAAAAASVLRHRFLQARADAPSPLATQGEAWLIVSSGPGGEGMGDGLRKLDCLQAAYRTLGFEPVAVRLVDEAVGEPAWPSLAGTASAVRRAAIVRRPRAVHVFSETAGDALEGLQGLAIPLLYHHSFEAKMAASTPAGGGAAQRHRLCRRADAASCASSELRDALERRSGALLPVLELTEGRDDERIQALDGLLKRAAWRVAVAVGGGIGNMIQCAPALRKLSDHYGCPVDVVLKEDFPGCGWLFAGAPWVGSVFSQTDAAAEMRFDVLFVFDSFGEVLPTFSADRLSISRYSYPFSLTQKMHEADFNLMCMRGFLGIPYVAADIPRYFLGRQVDRAPTAGRVGLHAGCKPGVWEAKRWPYFADLAQRLTSAGFDVVSFGGLGEAVQGTQDRTGTSLRDTIENIRGCSYFIANDSGLMHVADALNIPSTALFGPSSVVKNGPLAPTSQAVALEKSCAPCQFRRVELASCTCIGELSPDAVWERIAGHMARSGIGAARCDAPPEDSEDSREGPWAPLVVFSALEDGRAMPALPPGATLISGRWPHADGFPDLDWLHQMLSERLGTPSPEQHEAGYVFLSPQLQYHAEYLQNLSRHLARSGGRDIACAAVVYDPLSMAFDQSTDETGETTAALVTLGCFRAGTLLSADKADKRGVLRLVTASEPFLVVDARDRQPLRIPRLRQALEAQPLSDAEHQLGFEAAARAQGLERPVPSWRDGSLQTTASPVRPGDAEAAKRLITHLLERPSELVVSSGEDFAECLETVAAFGLHGAFTEVVQTHHATMMERHPALVGDIFACVALVLEPEALGRLLLSAARPVLRGASPHPIHGLLETARKFCPPAVLGDLLHLIDASGHAEYLRQDSVMTAVGDRLGSAPSLVFLLPRTKISHADFVARTSGGHEILRAVRARDRAAFITQVNLFLERSGGTFPLSLLLRTHTQDVATLGVEGQIRYAEADPARDTLALAVILGDATAAAPQLDSGALALTDPLVVAWRSRRRDFKPLNAVLGRWLTQAGAEPVRLEGACRLELFRAAYAGHGLPDAADHGTVSVVMAAHDSEARLMRLAVESVLAQTYRNLELIIVDDGSDPEHATAIRELAVLDSRIRFLRTPRSHGPYHCRNLALDIARGAFVAFHDDDDVAHPQRLDLQLATLVEAPTRQVCFATHMRFDSTGAIQFEVNPDRLNLRGDGPVTSVFRRGALETLGRFAQVRSRGDIEMRSRVEACYGRHALCHVEAPLMYCAGNANSLSNSMVAAYGDYVALFRQGFGKRVMPPILNGRFVRAPTGRLPIPHVLRSSFDTARSGAHD